MVETTNLEKCEEACNQRDGCRSFARCVLVMAEDLLPDELPVQRDHQPRRWERCQSILFLAHLPAVVAKRAGGRSQFQLRTTCENHARKMRTFFTRRLEPKTKSSNAFKWSLRPKRK